jgi:hypothetical protein
VARGTDILSQELQDDFIVLSRTLHILDVFSLRQENGLIGNLKLAFEPSANGGWKLSTGPR